MGTPERDHAEILARLAVRHPGLKTSHFRATSPYDAGYNCMAFAGGDTRRMWHPSAYAGLYWPGGPAADDLAGWMKGFENLGYRECSTPDLVTGVEKVAIYCDEHRLPLHVARQLPSGYWTSKMGKCEDVEHELQGLEGLRYGHVTVLMSRFRDPQHQFSLAVHPPHSEE